MTNLLAFMATNILGSFAFDEGGNLVDKALFPKDPEKIAQKLAASKSGEIIDEEKKILDSLIIQGYKEVVWDKEKKYKGIECICKSETLAKQKLQEGFRSMALQLKWVSSQTELNEILTKVNVLAAKSEIGKTRNDELIMRCISVLDEVMKTENIFSEKLKEWYGLHFPEMWSHVKSNEQYAEVVSKYGNRDKITDNELQQVARKSAGMNFSEDDIKQLQSFASSISGLYSFCRELEKYTEALTKENIPNLAAVAGSLLSARLLNIAGGLEKIAKMPSSTIQLLGAEKALFRHLKEKTRAPKYGIIFSHPLVQNAPKEKKGKMARLVAAKLSIAARIDYFSKDDRGEVLRRELENESKMALGGQR